MTKKPCYLSVPTKPGKGSELKKKTILRLPFRSDEMAALDSLDKGGAGQNTMVGWLREHDPDFY